MFAYINLSSIQEYIDFTSTHPLRSCGYPVVIAPIVLFSDDTSGNKSKKWNKFDCWCMTLAGLPQHLANKPQNIHFISCSNSVSALEMVPPLVEDLLRLEKGIHAYDASKGTEVLVFAPVMSLLCDNPRASELLNHLGSNAKKFCRICLVNHFIIHYTFFLLVDFLIHSVIKQIQGKLDHSEPSMKH